MSAENIPICSCLGKCGFSGCRCNWENMVQTAANDQKIIADGELRFGDVTQAIHKRRILSIAEAIVDIRPTKGTINPDSLFIYCTVPTDPKAQSECSSYRTDNL